MQLFSSVQGSMRLHTAAQCRLANNEPIKAMHLVDAIPESSPAFRTGKGRTSIRSREHWLPCETLSLTPSLIALLLRMDIQKSQGLTLDMLSTARIALMTFPEDQEAFCRYLEALVCAGCKTEARQNWDCLQQSAYAGPSLDPKNMERLRSLLRD